MGKHVKAAAEMLLFLCGTAVLLGGLLAISELVGPVFAFCVLLGLILAGWAWMGLWLFWPLILSGFQLLRAITQVDSQERSSDEVY